MKTFVYRSFIGILFGAFLHVTFVSAGILLGGVKTINADLFLTNAVGIMACSWLFSVTPLYYEIKKWNLMQQTLVHFMTVIVLFFVLAFTIGWMPISMPFILKQVFIFMAIYAVIWTLFYYYFKYQTKRLNEELKKL